MALLKHTLVHITATVSQVNVYSLAAMSLAMTVRVGQRAVSVFVSVAEEKECSWCSSQRPRVVSVFVVAIVRRTGIARRLSSSLNLNIIVHMQVKFADSVIARSTGQANIHTQSAMKSR